jgi:hypothetical protein
MDTPLRQKVELLEKENPDSLIQFFGKCADNIDQDMEKKLKEAGIVPESIVQNIFTASAAAKNIKQASLLEFVTSLELARQMDLK